MKGIFSLLGWKNTSTVEKSNVPVGRDTAIVTARKHYVNQRPLKASIPPHMTRAMFGMGCFWGVERLFWQVEGIYLTAAGYAGGQTLNPTYAEVCTGYTEHNEVVQLIFNETEISYNDLLRLFWQGHDPTQGMRQGNDRGSQYRSGIYAYGEQQLLQAQTSLPVYQKCLTAAGYGVITTEILPAPIFYYAERYHQQYLAKNPRGYCGVGGVNVDYPIELSDRV